MKNSQHIDEYNFRPTSPNQQTSILYRIDETHGDNEPNNDHKACKMIGQSKNEGNKLMGNK